MDDGRKIQSHLENPVDNVLIYVSKKVNPTLRKMGVTPNMITTLSTIIGIMAAVFIYKGYFAAAIVCVFFAYLLDCMDGNMARMFNMTSSFGDWYDHISDIVKYVAIYAAIILQPNMTRANKTVFIVVTLIMFILANIHLGCQEKAFNKKKKDSLSILSEPLCPDGSLIKYTRWVGTGTWTVVVMVCIALLGPK